MDTNTCISSQRVMPEYFITKSKGRDFIFNDVRINFLPSKVVGTNLYTDYRIHLTATSTDQYAASTSTDQSATSTSEMDTDKLDLNLPDNFFMRLGEEQITGYTFLMMTRKELGKCELKIGHSLALEDYIKGIAVE